MTVLNRLNSENPTERQRFGADVEVWVRDELRGKGFDAELIADWEAPYDLKIGDLPVEVKGARLRQRKVRSGYYGPEYRWFVDNLKDEDYLLALVTEDPDGSRRLFLAPSWAAFGRATITITSHPDKYTGRLSQYLENFEIVNEIAERRDQYTN